MAGKRGELSREKEAEYFKHRHILESNSNLIGGDPEGEKTLIKMVGKESYERFMAEREKLIEVKREALMGKFEEAGSEPFDRLIKNWTNKIDLIKQFIKIIPIQYDKNKLWWGWNHTRKCWEISDEVEILNAIERTTLANIIQSKERQEIINGLKQVGRSIKPQKVKKTWIQFGKEIVDIETGNRFEATPDYFVVNPIPWKLGKNERTPTMDRIFKEWVGKDYVKTLYEIIAFCLLTDIPLERFFILYGPGGNGKTRYLKLLRKFVGDENYVVSDLQLIASDHFETASLYKKLVCAVGETDFNTLKSTNLLKQFTGGDAMRYCMKFKGAFTDDNYTKLVVSSNSLPTTTDKTVGFQRRPIILDFKNKFSEKIEILDTIPENEYENLALKSIGVLIELLKKRSFHNEGTVEHKAERYEERSNPLQKFWKDNIAVDGNGFVYKFEFRDMLSAWLKQNGHREHSDAEIHKFMKDKQIFDGQEKASYQNQAGLFPYIRAWRGCCWAKKRGFIDDIRAKQAKQAKQAI